MNMTSQIYAAYVAGLCPLEVLMRYGPDNHRRILPGSARDETSLDRTRTSSRRKRALLLILTVGLAIGAWQLLSDFGPAKAAHLAARDFASARGLLLLILFLGLMIGAGELLTRIDASRPADVAGRSAALERNVLDA